MCKKMCRVIATAKQSQGKVILVSLVPTIDSMLYPTQRPSQNACMGCHIVPTPAWVVVTVLGGATTIAPVGPTDGLNQP